MRRVTGTSIVHDSVDRWEVCRALPNSPVTTAVARRVSLENGRWIVQIEKACRLDGLHFSQPVDNAFSGPFPSRDVALKVARAYIAGDFGLEWEEANEVYPITDRDAPERWEATWPWPHTEHRCAIVRELPIPSDKSKEDPEIQESPSENSDDENYREREKFPELRCAKSSRILFRLHTTALVESLHDSRYQHLLIPLVPLSVAWQPMK